MTWVRFTRDWAYRNTRYTEKFKAGDHKNVPRHVAEAAVAASAGEKERRKDAKAGTDSAEVSAAGSG